MPFKTVRFSFLRVAKINLFYCSSIFKYIYKSSIFYPTYLAVGALRLPATVRRLPLRVREFVRVR